MQKEEIKKAIKEYALKHSSAYVTASLIESIINGFTEQLSKDYCIVPKVEILNQHAWYMQRMKEVSSNRQMNRGKAIALENLFGKEMFEEDKE
ncbi:MAG: hypothetical protein HDS59_08490 [Barnesiella sp.]|nr:hypothetical protein [Barnesiella sp.]